MDFEQILKQANQEASVLETLEKLAAEIEEENPELRGQVMSMIDTMSEEDLDYLLDAAEQNREARGDNDDDVADVADGEGDEDVPAQKAAYEEEEMLAKVAEADVLAEYLGVSMFDAMIKRANQYGLNIQTPETAALEELVDALGEKLAQQLVGVAEKSAQTHSDVIDDEKVASELYDIGRLACIGRLYLEHAQE